MEALGDLRALSNEYEWRNIAYLTLPAQNGHEAKTQTVVRTAQD
jgi:hypothetical protein